MEGQSPFYLVYETLTHLYRSGSPQSGSAGRSLFTGQSLSGTKIFDG